MATTIVQPIDMIKVRLQVYGETLNSSLSSASTTPSGKTHSSSANVPHQRPSTITLTRRIIHEEGILSLWRGLSAGYMRQVVYGSARLGLFRVFSDKVKETYYSQKGKNLPLYIKISIGMVAGGLASAIGSPIDLILIRLQADTTLPVNQRRNYKGLFDAMSRVIKDEGITGLFTGATPTIIRAICLNAAMMSTSDQAKESLGPYLGGEKSVPTVFVSSALSGVASALSSLPADLVKTRLQRMIPDPHTGQLPYKGFFDCARKIAQREGLGAFYVGTGTYIFRIAPHAFITLLLLDYMNNFIVKHNLLLAK